MGVDRHTAADVPQVVIVTGIIACLPWRTTGEASSMTGCLSFFLKLVEKKKE